jgi:hypothetical protein
MSMTRIRGFVGVSMKIARVAFLIDFRQSRGWSGLT